MFFNAHTHATALHTGVVALRNLHEHFDAVPQTGCFSVGLHPWFLPGDLPASLTQLQQAVTLPSVWAIGECGLDKFCATPWALQEKAFTAQVALANQLQKPLIIHCVKAYAEVLAILQQQRVAVPVIFHGFNKNAELAKQLVNKGYYLSLGHHLQQPRMQALLQQVPLSQVFLETDDQQISIEAVYQSAAALMQSSVDWLCLRLAENVEKVFGKSLQHL